MTWRHRVGRLALAIPAAALLAITVACAGGPGGDAAPYVPFFRDAVAAAKDKPADQIAGQFAQAAGAATLGEARQRWETFLSRYPPEMEFEDAVQKRYIDAGIYELIRINYRLGRVEEGDQLLRRADPLRVR